VEFNAPPDTIGHFGGGHIQGGPKNGLFFGPPCIALKYAGRTGPPGCLVPARAGGLVVLNVEGGSESEERAQWP